MRTRPLLIGAGALVFAAFSMSGQAQDIARWVDDHGVTHFGNPQFAPGDPHDVTLVDVQPANGMVVPEATNVSRGRPRFVIIKMKAKSNMRGWRGYQKNRISSSRNNRSRRY